MSSRQLEDRQEREQLEWIAGELGISVDELSQQDFDVDAHDGHDGAVYGYRVTFTKDADPEVLSKIATLQDGRWANIGFPSDNPGEE